MRLKSIRVLLIDELGQLTGNHMKILNRIFKKLHESTEFFGGIHVVATIDNFQLLIDDRDTVYQYSPLLFYFKPFVLQYFIRATCPLQQRLLRALRKHPKSATDRNEIIQLISDNCTFSNTFEELDIELPCLTTTKKGRNIISGKRAALQGHHQRQQIFICEANDYYISHGGVRNQFAQDSEIMDKISKESSLPSTSKIFQGQNVQNSVIINRRNGLIPRSTIGIITEITTNDNNQVENITVDFGGNHAITVLQRQQVLKKML